MKTYFASLFVKTCGVFLVGFFSVLFSNIGISIGEIKTEKALKINSEKSSLKASKNQLNAIKEALKKAKEVRRKLLSKTNNLDSDIKALRAKLISGAGLIRDHEVWVQELRDELASVNKVFVETKVKLSESQKKIGNALLALHRISQFPLESVVVREVSPGDAIRSALLLRTVVGDFDREISELRLNIRTLNMSKDEVDLKRDELSKAKTELESQRRVMQTLMGRKSRLRRRILAKKYKSEERLKFLGSQARSIRGLIVNLEKHRKSQKFQRSREKGEKTSRNNIDVGDKSKKNQSLDLAFGKMLFPAVGKIIAKFGQRGKEGSSHKGLTITTGSGAQVIAPFDGRVAFAGQFRGYGELLIIEHNKGYHTLLSGMERIEGVVGQWLVAGEPVGYMKINNMSREIAAGPVLYMEIRKAGLPVNPLPWLSVNEIKETKRGISG